jgi:hypothetical protein
VNGDSKTLKPRKRKADSLFLTFSVLFILQKLLLLPVVAWTALVK